MGFSEIMVRVGSKAKPALTMKEVADIANETFGVDILRDTSRKAKVVAVKMYFCLYCGKYLNFYHGQIANILHLERSTVTRHIKVLQDYIAIGDENYTRGFNSLYNQIENYKINK